MEERATPKTDELVHLHEVRKKEKSQKLKQVRVMIKTDSTTKKPWKLAKIYEALVFSLTISV